jgi:phosphatidate cytidylyltransferase
MNDLLVRTATALAMLAVTLVAAVKGGNVFTLFVAAAGAALFWEWLRIVRGWSWGWKLGGLIYCLTPAVALLWLRGLGQDGIALLLWTLIVTMATDIGAYFSGRLLGRRKLAPTISPNKTVEGLIGGVAAATLIGGGWILWLGLDMLLLFLAPLFALAAQGGDLFESWMKRRAGVKDSGKWLPGHGGLLDRLDGLIPVTVLTAGAKLADLI